MYYVPQSKGAAAKWVIIEEEFKQEAGKSTLVCTCMCVSNTMCEWVSVFKVSGHDDFTTSRLNQLWKLHEKKKEEEGEEANN